MNGLQIMPIVNCCPSKNNATISEVAKGNKSVAKDQWIASLEIAYKSNHFNF